MKYRLVANHKEGQCFTTEADTMKEAMHKFKRNHPSTGWKIHITNCENGLTYQIKTTYK